MPDRKPCPGPNPGETCPHANLATHRGGRCKPCAAQRARDLENDRYRKAQAAIRQTMQDARAVEPDTFGIKGAERVLRVMQLVAA